MREREAKRVADAMVETLVGAGIITFFGIPGGPVSPIFDAILLNQSARLIESRQETGAAFEAAGLHAATGEVACLVVTAGPGLTNCMTGVALASLRSTPLVVIAGDVAWSTGDRHLQNCGPEGLDAENMFRSVVRVALRISGPKQAVGYTKRAVDAATEISREGPALLVVPIDVSNAPCSSPRIDGMSVIARVTHVEEAVLREVAEGLSTAERPLLVLGGACRRIHDRARKLADFLTIPFVTTPRAKGVVSENHPRSLGHGGLAASAWAKEYTGRGVDFALVIGTDLDDCSIGQTRYVREGGKLVHVDLDPTVFNRNLPTHMAIVSDAGTFIDEFLGIAAEAGTVPGMRKEILDVKAGPRFEEGDPSTMLRPQDALRALEDIAPREARFVTDIGEHMLFCLHYLTAQGPGSFHIDLNLGSMGSGIGAAVGMALDGSGTATVCVCGDGGMQMMGMECLVAMKHKLPILFAVFNDARYNMVYHGYKQVFGREHPWETEMVDFANWAKSVGMRSTVVLNKHGMPTRESLSDALMTGPVLLDIRIDPSIRFPGGGRNEALQHMSMARSKAARKE